MTGHLEPEQAIALAYGLAEGSESATWSVHVRACAECRAGIEKLEKSRPGVLRALLAEDPSPGLESRVLARVLSRKPTRPEDSMSQPVAPRPSAGPVAVQLGLITREQLEAAQARQTGAPGRSLDQTLVDLKYLTPDQVRSILQEMSKASPPPPARPALPGLRSHAVHAKPAPRSTWALAGAAALILVGGLAAFFAFQGESEPAPEVADKPKKSEPVKPLGDPAPPPPQKEKAPDPEKQRIRVILRKLPGHTDLVTRFNAAADKINSMRDPEQYKPVLKDLEDLVAASKGTPVSEDIRDAYKDVIESIKSRGEEVFGFLSDEVARLSTGGKYGDAMRSWDWFPGNLDLVGSYAARIEGIKKQTLEDGRAFYARLTEQADRLIKENQLPDAQLALFKALEIDFPEFSEDAYRRINELTKLLEVAANKEAEAELARFAKEEAEKGETAGLESRLQGQFFELVSRRRLEGAREHLSKQGAAATPAVQKVVVGMNSVLDEIAKGLVLAGESLKGQVGKSVALSFLENGEARSRTFTLKAVRDGKIVYSLEGRELTPNLSDLHSQELERLAGALPEGDKALLSGVARFLAAEFDQAHTILTGAGDRGKAIVAFVEGSADFLARNAPILKERAARHMGAKEWEKAVPILTRLASIPAERQEALKNRARANYQINNFGAVVLDVRTLFQMDDFSPEIIELLNQSYQRSAMLTVAAEIYETAAARLPKKPELTQNLYKIYMVSHQYDKARAALKRALDGGGISASEYDGLVRYAEVIERGGMEKVTHKSQFGRYDIVTDISPEFANKMARIMDDVYKAYCKFFLYKKNDVLRFKVLVFQNEQDFLKYNSSTSGINFPPGTRLGAWYSGFTKQLVGFNLNDWEEMTSTFRHEGLHQFLDYFVENCPSWFNEGYASYFETSTVDQIRFNQERHRAAKAWVRDPKNTFKDLFLMDTRTFQSKGAIMYGPSWAAVYYLLVTGRKSVLDAYLEALMEGKNYQQAFDTIFGPGRLNFEEFETDLRRAIEKDEYKEKEEAR